MLRTAKLRRSNCHFGRLSRLICLRGTNKIHASSKFIAGNLEWRYSSLFPVRKIGRDRWETFLRKRKLICDRGRKTRTSPYRFDWNRADFVMAQKTLFPRASYCIWSTKPVGCTSAVSSRWKERELTPIALGSGRFLNGWAIFLNDSGSRFGYSGQ